MCTSEGTMSLKTNEKFFWADRKNRLERARLDMFLKNLDRQKCNIALDIDREKKSIVKGFNRVKRTSGQSEEAIPSEGDSGYQTSETYVTGLRLSERRLLEWRQTEKQLEKFLVQNQWEKTLMFEQKAAIKKRSRAMSAPVGVFKKEIPSRLNSTLEDDVFEVEEREEQMKRNQLNSNSMISINADDLEKKIFSEYSEMISSAAIPEPSDIIGKRSIKKLTRPQTAHTIPLSTNKTRQYQRPNTAHCTKKINRKHNKYIDGSILNRRKPDSIYANYNNRKDGSLEEKTDREEPHDKSIEHLQSDSDGGFVLNASTMQEADFVLSKTPKAESLSKDKLEGSMDSEKNISNLNLTTVDQRVKSNVAFEEQQTSINKNGTLSPRRSRHVSISSYAPSDKGHLTNTASEVSSFSRFGSVSDVFSLDSEGSRRPSKWREYVAADSAKLPESKRFLNLATVVKCALAFSKTARKRALNNLVTEQSMDVEDAIRRERLRKMHSRNNVLNAFAQMWAAQAVNQIEETPEH